MDYWWDEENHCVFYASASTESIEYYPDTNIIKVNTGEYAGQYKYVASITGEVEYEDESQAIADQGDETLVGGSEQNYKWYLDYNLFANKDETVRIEVYGIDDNSFGMIFGDIYWANEVEHNWQFEIGVVPDEIGADGEFIYIGEGGRLVYYPYENYISVEMGDEEYDGHYFYYLY